VPREERRRAKFTVDDIKGLVALVTQHRVAELSVQVGRMKVRIVGAVNGSAAQPKPAVSDILGWDCPVCSPAVGVVRWLLRNRHTPQPGQPVARGAVLGHVEALGVRHEIRAPVAGVVAGRLVKDNEPVEFGQALLIVRAPAVKPG
jgi:biotin carboxyl carrier protein